MRKVKGRSFYKEPWYNSYRSMMDRCKNLNARNYPLYGGRGITVCKEWDDIEKFEQWVKESNYEVGLTLERKDVNGNYEPTNCEWVNRKRQANNRRNTVYVTIDGVTKTISEWAEFSGINRSTLNNRYSQGIRGIMLLHRVEDTKFKEGYNRYVNSKHYSDYNAPTIIEADKKSEDNQKINCKETKCENCVNHKYCDYESQKSEE